MKNRLASVSGKVRGTVTASVPTVLLLLLFVLVSQTARAQSTIFNIPSTDTVVPIVQPMASRAPIRSAYIMAATEGTMR